MEIQLFQSLGFNDFSRLVVAIHLVRRSCYPSVLQHHNNSAKKMINGQRHPAPATPTPVAPMLDLL